MASTASVKCFKKAHEWWEMTKATIVQIISQTLSFIKDIKINYKTQEVELLNSPTYYVNYNLYACIFKTKALLCFLIREPYRLV